MNEDDMTAHEELAGDELERLLERYARVRLDPSQAATRRARAAVMEEAWRRRLAADGAPAGGARRRGPFAGWSVRRLTGTLAAAVVAGLLVGSSVFAGSRAGGPLYGTRLAVEELTLPSDAGARLEAEIARTQTRLAEAVDASARGDDGALHASLEAYGQGLAALGSEVGAGADRALEAVRLHRAVLVSVLGTAPAAAVAGLDRAIARSDELIKRLGEAAAPGGSSGGSPGGNGDQRGGGGQADPHATPAPGATPKVDPTPKPAKDPKAGASAKPDRTPRAGTTPKPAKDAKAGTTPRPRPTPDPRGQDAGSRTTPAP